MPQCGKNEMNDPKIIVALDFDTPEAALQLAGRLDPALCRLKVGKELFTCAGPDLVARLVEAHFEVFLDLKFHDIPHTVAQACKAAARLGVWMVNVHALGGRKMMNAAREALENLPNRPKLIAVTVLTSMGKDDLAELGFSGEPQDSVLRLAKLAQECGLDGVVCSAREAAPLRDALGKDFCLVTPGIRPAAASPDDQVRVATPAEALKQGASYLVIGRPITQAADPLQALKNINFEIGVAQ
jgi:orotidine-5'-phosphate decarboxylase